jgi:hypothetical protein
MLLSAQRSWCRSSVSAHGCASSIEICPLHATVSFRHETHPVLPGMIRGDPPCRPFRPGLTSQRDPRQLVEDRLGPVTRRTRRAGSGTTSTDASRPSRRGC